MEIKLPAKKQFALSIELPAETPRDLLPIFAIFKEYIEKDSDVWVLDERLQEFRFDLPSSRFEGEGPGVDHLDLPPVEEYFGREPLTAKQLSEIWAEGQFTVESKLYPIDHSWKLSGVLTKGYRRRNKRLNSYKAKALFFLLKLTRLFSFKGSRAFRKLRGDHFPHLGRSLMNILSFFVSFIDVLIGLPKFNIDRDFEYKLRSRQQELISTSKSKQYLDLPMNQYLALSLQTPPEKHVPKTAANFELLVNQQRKEKERWQGFLSQVQDLERELNDEWDSHEKRLVDSIEDCEEEQFEARKSEIKSEKNQFVFEKLRAKAAFDPKFIQSLVAKVESLSIIQNQHELFAASIDRDREALSKELQQKYPVRSQIKFWMEEHFTKQDGLKPDREWQFMQTLPSLLQELPEEKLLYEISLKELGRFTHDQEAITLFRRGLKEPFSSIKVKRKVFPPHDVKTVPATETSPARYYLDRHASVVINSTFVGWRVALFATRFVYYSLGLTRFLFKYAVVGEYGVLGLVRCQNYYTDYSVNAETGEKKLNRKEKRPILAQFSQLLDEIRRSREAFEATPDRGIFGKNCGRVFNLFDCYLIKLFAIGIVWLLLIHPLVNVLWIALSLVVACSSVVWILITLLSRWALAVFVYDLDRFNRARWRPYSTFDDLVRRYKVFFLVRNLYEFLVKGVFQLVLLLICGVLYPLMALLILVYGYLAYLSRGVYDLLVFYLILKPFAKIPEKDSRFARRVSGPGLSHELYYTLSLEDMGVLLLSKLEEVQLAGFRASATAEINSPENRLKELSRRVSDPFKATLDLGSDFYENGLAAEKLRATLAQQISERTKNLPQLRNRSRSKIKFSAQNLQEIKRLASSLIAKMSPAMDLDSYIWRHFEVPVGRPNLLTSRVLQSTLGGSALQSTEDTDKQIVLANSKSKTDAAHLLLKDVIGKDLPHDHQEEKVNFVNENQRKIKELVALKLALDFVALGTANNLLSPLLFNAHRP